jgi:hypothetical protein
MSRQKGVREREAYNGTCENRTFSQTTEDLLRSCIPEREGAGKPHLITGNYQLWFNPEQSLSYKPTPAAAFLVNISPNLI